MKRILMIAAMAVLATSAFAQIKWGVKAGINISNVKGDDSSMDSRVGPLFGGFAVVGINDKISFQPELLYSSEGATDEASNEGMNAEETLTLDYLNIPLLFKYSLGKGFNLLAGPQIGILLSAEDEIKYSYMGEGETTTDNIKEYLDGTNLSFNFGGAWQAQSGFGVDVRYNLGLSNIAEEDGDMKTKGIQISAFYVF